MSEPESPVCVALTTCPDEGTARRIASALVEERLAACVNIVPDMTSVYRWEGVVETASECLLLVKTRRERLEALRRRLEELHPYDLPELVALPVEGGSSAYLKWVVEETGSAT
ncbi:MAG TPA: divalent-cation tolerance protein CutA [Gemmatimonadota bacterium]|nr:divalent-cation tolerance protein CutA [Gemmatimonadota bacterium]